MQEEDAARISKLTAETCDLKAELSASNKEAKDAKEREIVELTRGFEKQLQEHDKQAKTDASRRVQQVGHGRPSSCLSCPISELPKPPLLLHLAGTLPHQPRHSLHIPPKTTRPAYSLGLPRVHKGLQEP